VCMGVCACVCLYVRMCESARMQVGVCLSSCECVHIYTYQCLCLFMRNRHERTHNTHTYIHLICKSSTHSHTPPKCHWQADRRTGKERDRDNTLQHTATHCNTLQHTASTSQTHCSSRSITLIFGPKRTGWRRPIGCLISVGRFLQQRPMSRGSFAKRDLQLKASYTSSPPCSAPQAATHANGYPSCTLNTIRV